MKKKNPFLVTGPNLKANKYHRLIAVCVLLLLVLLVIVIIVLSVKFKSLATEKDQVQKQKDELQEKVNNLGEYVHLTVRDPWRGTALLVTETMSNTETNTL